MNYNYNRVSDNLDAVRTDTGATVSANITGAPATFGVTLTNGITYVFPMGAYHAPVPSQSWVLGMQLRWDNAIAFNANLEECNFPALWPFDNAQGAVDVADSSLVVGNWIPIRPAAGYVEVAGGGTYTPATGIIAVAAGQAGGCTINLSLWGMARARLKIAVGGTGGLVRCALNGKGVV